MRICAVIPAAGAGARLGASIPKAFIEVAGKPILFHTIDRLDQSVTIERWVVPVPPAEREALCRQHARRLADGRLTFVDGGATRSESVLLSLDTLGEPSGLVLVHDAVRPLVAAEVVRQVVEAAAASGAAIAAAPCHDTVKEADESMRVTRTLSRGRLWLVQTPQAFDARLLARAYRQAMEQGIDATDDSALVERLGVAVRVVPSTRANFKITTPEDLDLFRLIVAEG